MRAAILAVMCGACVHSSTVLCDGGVTCPQGTTCYVRPSTTTTVCLDAEQRPACDGRGEGEPCTTSHGEGLCSSGVCFDVACGDGFLTLPEECDGPLLGAKTSCKQLGYYDDVPLTCAPNCTYDVSACTGECNDGIVNGTELCDGAPPQKTCADLGYAHGFLECSMCGPGLADCGDLGWQVSKVAPSTIRDVHGTSDKNVFAVGANSAVQYFNGSLWTAIDITSCVPIPADYSFDSVWTVGPQEAWAGGPGGILVHLTPTGCTESFVDNMVDTISIYDLWAPSATEVYVATGYGTWRFSSNTWTKVDAASVERVWGRSANDIYVSSGGGGGTPYVRHFDGTTWSDITPVLGSPFTKILALFGDANNVYVGGANAEGAALAKRVGTSYQLVLSDRPGEEVSAGSSSGARVFTGGTTPSSVLGQIPEVLTFDGTTWTNLGEEAFSSVVGSINGLWVSESGRMFAVSKYSRLIQTYPGGTFINDDVGAQSTAIAARQSNANEAFTIIDQKHVYAFDDAQQKWILDYDGTTNPATTVWIDPTTGTVYALESTGGLLRRDAASTWTEIDPTTFDLMGGSAANDLWLLNTSDNAGVISHWDGAQMTTCASCTTNHRLLAISASSATNVIAVGYQGAIVRWDGNAWTTMTSGTTQDLWGVHVMASGEAWAVGTSSAVLHLVAGTWTTIPFDPPLLLDSVTGTNSNDMFFAGESGALYHWDGTHFSPVRSPTTQQIMAMTIAGDSIYLADLGGFVHRLIRTVAW